MKPEEKKPEEKKPEATIVVANKPEEKKPVEKNPRSGRSSTNEPTKVASAKTPEKTSDKPVEKASEKTNAKATTEKPSEPEVTGPKAKLSVRVSSGYALGGKGVSGGSATVTVDGSGRRFKVTSSDGAGLVVSVDATATESGVALSVSSEPWAIVRVDSLGRGRTPQKVVVANGARAEIMLKSPSGGEVTLFVKAN